MVVVFYVGISIASFELFWQFSYAYFQNQWWVLNFQFPQARILIQNIMFALCGIIVLLHYWAKEYKLNINRLTIFLSLGTIGMILLWWYYPFPTPKLTVYIEGYGMWSSSPRFPQTMYTIQPNINDSFGIMFHIEDAGVHLVNNLAKIFMTLTYYSLFKIKQR